MFFSKDVIFNSIRKHHQVNTVRFYRTTKVQIIIHTKNNINHNKHTSDTYFEVFMAEEYKTLIKLLDQEIQP